MVSLRKKVKKKEEKKEAHCSLISNKCNLLAGRYSFFQLKKKKTNNGKPTTVNFKVHNSL